METILITGAGRGIGFAAAEVLIRPTNKLILITKTNQSRKKLAKNFPAASIFSANLADEASRSTLIASIKRTIKRLDVLVNNAGFYLGKNFEKIRPEELDELYRIHLQAPFILTQKLLPLLKKSKHPQIINISSAANFARLPTESAYTAVKAGLSALGDVLQKELQKYRIRITTIHPWTVNTHDLDRPEDYLRPEDIGELIFYIVNTHPNCQILNVELAGVSDWRGSWPPWAKKIV